MGETELSKPDSVFLERGWEIDLGMVVIRMDAVRMVTLFIRIRTQENSWVMSIFAAKNILKVVFHDFEIEMLKLIHFVTMKAGQEVVIHHLLQVGI